MLMIQEQFSARAVPWHEYPASTLKSIIEEQKCKEDGVHDSARCQRGAMAAQIRSPAAMTPAHLHDVWELPFITLLQDIFPCDPP
jgi:hypothetical protein